MGMYSIVTMKAGVAALSFVAVLAAACGDEGDAEMPDPTSSPTQPVYVNTPTPEPQASPSPAETEAPATPTMAAEKTPVSLEWLDGNADVPPLPASPAPQVRDAALQGVIESAVPEFDGEYSVVVQNLADGRYAAYNESRVYYAASLFKAGLLYEAYRQRDQGLLDFSMEVELTEEYAEYDLGTLEYLELEAGDTITIADAVRAMTIVSDTPMAVLMQDLIGVQADQTLLDLGLKETQFLNRELPTSARDMARLFSAIATGEGVSDGSRMEMLGLLRQEWFAEGIVASVPAGTVVAHKSGSFSDATHDVAVVWGPSGPYISAVLTDASFDFTYVRRIARAVWEYFEANP